MSSRLLKFIADTFDIYGHPINVNLDGSDVFKTKFGAFVSLITYALVIFNLVNLVTSFIDKSNQMESFQELRVEDYDGNVFLNDQNY